MFKILVMGLTAVLLVSGSMQSVFAESKKVVVNAATAKKSLFDRLGGAPAITAVVDSFVDTTAVNPKVNFFRGEKYKGLDVVHLKKQLTAFMIQVTGGPSEYKGRDMKTAHMKMQITADEFNALAGDLAATLDKFKVPKAEKDELMTIAASTQKDIVEK
jgi:hemoglobin